MNKDMIVQFVCFATNLEHEEFIAIWEPYAKELSTGPGNIVLQEATSVKAGNKFRYVSQHECSPDDFMFAFMKGRSRMHFPEHKARVLQAGGYTPAQVQCHHNEAKGDVKVMAFLPHGESDLDFFHRQTYRHLNIYEAYFESCAYSYIMEFFLYEHDAPALIKELKTKVGIEVAYYKEWSLFNPSKKRSGSLL